MKYVVIKIIKWHIIYPHRVVWDNNKIQGVSHVTQKIRLKNLQLKIIGL